MTRKIKIQQKDTRLRIENFNKRWNINLSETERWENFKNRVLNTYALVIGNDIKNDSTCEDEFFDLIGIHKRRINGFEIIGEWNNPMKDSPTYNYFADSSDVKGFILGLEVLSWMETLEQDDKNRFFSYVQDDIVTTGVPIEMKQTKTNVLFYPAGAKLLDNKLVNDNLDWLSQYSDCYDVFESALKEFGTKGKERDVVDKLRLSFELLLKNILNNKKSLENQEKEIGNYLKTKNVSTEISNLFWKVIDYYSKYQNSNAKHENNVPPDEVEFILYLTGTLMRFLLTKN